MLSFQEYVSQIQQEIDEIDTSTYFESADQFSLLIDVRETDELESGIIAGAIAIPRGVLESKLIALSSCQKIEDACSWLKKQRIAIYCRSGARSALAAKSLKAMGLENVVSVRGGITEWREKGYPIEGAR